MEVNVVGLLITVYARMGGLEIIVKLIQLVGNAIIRNVIVVEMECVIFLLELVCVSKGTIREIV